ncbi:MAG: c-type cytochrome [Acidobacteriaceae bacterium]|nr:c-type cytochrome [Acidobacteriaceae bacterium]
MSGPDTEPKRTPVVRTIVNVWATLSLVGFVLTVAAGLILWSKGLGARPEPSALEANVSMHAWESSIPTRYEEMKNPISAAAFDLNESASHYAEHCAVCHGMNGKGETAFKGTMYPRPPDLTSTDTQEMSDGELYWTIKNGVRWSGMPAFGEPGENDQHAWKIVAFLRQLPKLSPEQIIVLQQSHEAADHSHMDHDH